MILSSVAFIQFALCVDISDGYKYVSEQEDAVALLSSMMTDLQKNSDADEEKFAEVLEKYKDASQKTKAMIDTTLKLIDGASVCGVNEIDGDDADNADMLYCSTINAVRRILALNEKLQIYVQEDNKRSGLAQDSNALKQLLK